jgi:hypothetical protein
MKTKSTLLLWLVLPLACVGSPSTDTPDAGAPVISINPRAPRPMFVGGAQQLSAGAPGVQGKVTWHSSNPSVAAVSGSGLVHGISAGTATVTAAVSSPGFAIGTAVVDVAVRQPMLGDASALRRHRRR